MRKRNRSGDATDRWVGKFSLGVSWGLLLNCTVPRPSLWPGWIARYCNPGPWVCDRCGWVGVGREGQRECAAGIPEMDGRTRSAAGPGFLLVHKRVWRLQLQSQLRQDNDIDNQGQAKPPCWRRCRWRCRPGWSERSRFALCCSSDLVL